MLHTVLGDDHSDSTKRSFLFFTTSSRLRIITPVKEHEDISLSDGIPLPYNQPTPTGDLLKEVVSSFKKHHSLLLYQARNRSYAYAFNYSRLHVTQ
jgi:hypothetical protein